MVKRRKTRTRTVVKYRNRTRTRTIQSFPQSTTQLSFQPTAGQRGVSPPARSALGERFRSAGIKLQNFAQNVQTQRTERQLAELKRLKQQAQNARLEQQLREVRASLQLNQREGGMFGGNNMFGQTLSPEQKKKKDA